MPGLGLITYVTYVITYKYITSSQSILRSHCHSLPQRLYAKPARDRKRSLQLIRPLLSKGDTRINKTWKFLVVTLMCYSLQKYKMSTNNNAECSPLSASSSKILTHLFLSLKCTSFFWNTFFFISTGHACSYVFFRGQSPRGRGDAYASIRVSLDQRC